MPHGSGLLRQCTDLDHGSGRSNLQRWTKSWVIPFLLSSVANSDFPTLAPGAHFVISFYPNEESLVFIYLDEDMMLPIWDSAEFDVSNKEQVAVRLSPHFVMSEKLLEVITCAVDKLSLDHPMHIKSGQPVSALGEKGILLPEH